MLTEAQQAMVVQAVRVLGLETGGVDLLFDKNGDPFIAEMNFPNNFMETQRVTKIDIAAEMVAYLAKKASRVSIPEITCNNEVKIYS